MLHMKNLIVILTGVLITIYTSGQSGKTGMMIDTSTIKELDLEKYMGKWYEIARFPHRFEKDLVGVTATYSLRDNGKINVINQGYLFEPGGKLKTAKGKAKIPDRNEIGKLKVSFFLFFYADYYILELDTENYQWAMIGSSSDRYLWILNRTPQIDPEIYRMLVERAKKRGYDTGKLLVIPQ